MCTKNLQQKLNPDVSKNFIIPQFLHFLSKNGPDFESHTKLLQKNNPLYSFLFDGPSSDYYKKLRDESSENFSPGISPEDVEILLSNVKVPDRLSNHVSSMKESLKKYAATLLRDQEAEIYSKIKFFYFQKIVNKIPEEFAEELNGILSNVLRNCTKDAIYNAKNWILKGDPTNSVNYISARIVSAEVFLDQLHLVYLLNDLAHHSVRKNDKFLRDCLNSVIPFTYSFAWIVTESTEERARLERLVPIWRQNSYFSDEICQALEKPRECFDGLKMDLVTEFWKDLCGIYFKACDKLVERVNEYRGEISGMVEDIPVGVLVELIGIDDFGYSPLDGSREVEISAEGMEEAVHEFYHGEGERDGQGWERGALDEFFQRKEAAREARNDIVQ